jgi:hypothetical protein
VVVGIASVYGLDDQGIGGEIFRSSPHLLVRLALGLTQPSIQLVPGNFRGFIGQVVALTIHPYPAPLSKEEITIFAFFLGLCGLL